MAGTVALVGGFRPLLESGRSTGRSQPSKISHFYTTLLKFYLLFFYFHSYFFLNYPLYFSIVLGKGTVLRITLGQHYKSISSF